MFCICCKSLVIKLDYFTGFTAQQLFVYAEEEETLMVRLNNFCRVPGLVDRDSVFQFNEFLGRQYFLNACVKEI